MIAISHLSKSFGTVQAVKDLSFEVARGSLFAFLGVNGAGKSTTISILCGQLKKDEGSVWIDGKNLEQNLREIRAQLGVVYQSSVLDQALTVRDNLFSRAALYGYSRALCAERVREVSSLLALEELMGRTVAKLSGGQKRRVDVARALLHHPTLLILDEPTTGLDPGTRAQLWQVIQDLRRSRGMTVFLTTHYMEEAADADDVLILDAGQAVARGTPLGLKNQFTADNITLYGVEEEQVRRLDKPAEKIGNQTWRIPLADTREATRLILAYPEIFVDFEIVKGKMDDVFLAATGKQLSAQRNTSEKKGGEKK